MDTNLIIYLFLAILIFTIAFMITIHSLANFVSARYLAKNYINSIKKMNSIHDNFKNKISK